MFALRRECTGSYPNLPTALRPNYPTGKSALWTKQSDRMYSRWNIVWWRKHRKQTRRTSAFCMFWFVSFVQHLSLVWLILVATGIETITPMI